MYINRKSGFMDKLVGVFVVVILFCGLVFTLDVIARSTNNAELQDLINDLTSEGYTAYADTDGNWIVSGDAEIQGSLTAATGRTATYVIAASNAPDNVKNQADYVWDGTGDATTEIIQPVFTACEDYSIITLLGNFDIATEAILSGKTGVIINGNAVLRRVDSMAVANPALAETGWGNIFRIYNCTGITIRDLVFDGNYTNQTYCNDGTHPTTGLPWGAGGLGEDNYDNIFLQSSSNCTIDNVFSYDSGTNNIRIGATLAGTIETSSDYNTVKNCYVSGGRNGILLYSSGVLDTIAGTGNNIEGNTCQAHMGYAGVYVYSNDTRIFNNQCDFGAGSPLGTSNSDGIRLTTGIGADIIGNKCNDNIGYGILVGSGFSKAYIYGNDLNSNAFAGCSISSDNSTFNDNFINADAGNGITVPGDNCKINDNWITSLNHGIYVTGDRCSLDGNTISGAKTSSMYGIYINGSSDTSIIGNNIYNYYGAIRVYTTSTDKDVIVNDNIITGCTKGILPGTLSHVSMVGNHFETVTTMIDGTVNSTSSVRGNMGYIAPGESRTASGSLTGGAVNATLFSWHNPEAQDIIITKVVINITTGDADAANIDVGIADDAAYTNGGTEFFNDLKGETVQVNDSWTTTEHTQTVWVLCQDSASATDGWIVAKLLDNDGTSIVGSYYIEYVGK